MPSRRAHTKTRHGCQACKRRKIRCDLIQPVCRNCDRNKELCSFYDSLRQPVILPFLMVPKPLERIETQDSRLLQVYTAFTSRTLTDRKLQSGLWQTCIPQLAASSRYLQDGMLALVILHERCIARSNGISALANQVRPLLHGGVLSRMLDRVPDPTDLMLEDRQQRTVQGRGITEHERDHGTEECRALTARLQSTLRSAAVGGVSQDHAIVWPLSASKNLKTRMRHRDPTALILLAHYGLLICFFESRLWFLQGIGPRLVHTIAGELPTEQRKQILWIERILGHLKMGNSF